MKALSRRSQLAASGFLLLALLAVPATASAHERRTIANGKYDVVVGWNTEPTYVGLNNSASIRVSQGGSDPAVPIQGLEKTLKVQVQQGAAVRVFPLTAAFGQPGYYLADFIPTREGDYIWTFTGKINDDTVNEKFDTADGKIDGVQGIAALEFPLTPPDAAQQSQALTSAQAEAQANRLLALTGIGLGALGLLGMIGLWLTRSRPSAPGRGTSTKGL